MTVTRHVIPRPAPPGTQIVWERTISEVGHFYILGAVYRKEGKSYLLRVSVPEKNDSVACLIMPDGSVRKWYFDWENRQDEIRPVLDGAMEFVLIHHVLTS